VAGPATIAFVEPVARGGAPAEGPADWGNGHTDAAPAGALRRPTASAGPTMTAIPRHVAIIMDGNRRWADAHSLPVALGHRAGADAARRAIEAAGKQGVSWLTLFAFSSENWLRPAEEVAALTGLLRHYLRSEVGSLVKEGVRLRVIGDRARFGHDVAWEIERAEAATRAGARLNLTIALSYGGRAEIVAAARAIAEAARDGLIDPASIQEEALAARLFTGGMPDPDLIIRTSAEQRLSNFLLWQAAYAEFVFLDVLWPDFDADHMSQALAEFARRERRYGARAAAAGG
jgi:undecaprenyl diphosphate synthase